MSYLYGKLVRMMNRIVRNRQHISSHLDKCIRGMDFHIRNARNGSHHKSLKCRMGNVKHCIALVVVGIVPLVMVHQFADERSTFDKF